jgi:hypothetical protein
MQKLSFFGFALLATVLMTLGCTDLYLQDFYGSHERVYTVANAFDSTTSVQVTAKWDPSGHVALASKLVPRDADLHSIGLFVDMPKTEYNEAEHTITPAHEGVSTLEISYDRRGNLSQNILPIKILYGFCCQDVCNRQCGCGGPVHAGNQWYCKLGIGYCKPCCQLTPLKNCNIIKAPDRYNLVFIQAAGPAKIEESRK